MNWGTWCITISGKSWRGTPIGNLLPVEILDPKDQFDGPTVLKPTLEGVGKDRKSVV